MAPMDDEHRLDAHRLVAIRQALDDLWIARHHSGRCATTEGIGEVRREAVAEIRAITDPGWRPATTRTEGVADDEQF